MPSSHLFCIRSTLRAKYFHHRLILSHTCRKTSHSYRKEFSKSNTTKNYYIPAIGSRRSKVSGNIGFEKHFWIWKTFPGFEKHFRMNKIFWDLKNIFGFEKHFRTGPSWLPYLQVPSTWIAIARLLASLKFAGLPNRVHFYCLYVHVNISKSLIIHVQNTKEISTVSVVWILVEEMK